MKMIAAYPELSDVTASLSGTTLKITIVEREGPITAYDKSIPVDIVADKDAKVDELVVYNGTGVAKQGQTVKKGDIIVSGTVKYEYKGHTSYTNVHAMAKVLTYEQTEYVLSLDMYVPLEDAPFISEKVYYAFSNSYSTTDGIKEAGMVSIEEKNKVFTIGWIETPILYDEVRWYNVKNCRVKTTEEINDEIYESAKSRLTAKQSIRSVSFQVSIVEENRIYYTVLVDVATNIGTEQELK